MIIKLKKWLSGESLNANKRRKRKLIYELVLDFSLFPQIIAATLIYLGMRGESVLLIDRAVSVTYFLMFTELIVISIVSVFVRIYSVRYLIFAVAAQMIISALAMGYVRSYFRVFAVAALSIIAAAVNISALYGIGEIKNTDKGENE